MFERFEGTGETLGRCQGTTPGGGRFTVYDQGAHVAEWSPDGAEPVLYLSSGSYYRPRKAIRGGIPVSFPWFANGRKDNKSPAHGFARLATWQLVDGQESGGLTTLRWQLDQTMIPAVEGVDPHRNRFELTFTQVFGDELDLTLRIRNTDESPLVVEEALHTYFRVGDVTQATVEGLSGTEYRDRPTGEWSTQIGPVTFPGEVDHTHWVNDGPVELHDPVLGRRIVLTTRHSANTVVWNPGEEKAADLADVGPGEWREFACVETANVRDKAIHLNPGQSHELGLRISVSPL